jgi:multimeric flavodoxin WrbA
MNVLIHDLKNFNKEIVLDDAKNDTVIISDNGGIRPCICCFGCWVKTPGQCVIDDGYNNLGVLLSRCSRLVIISECFYGAYSPFVQNVLNRSVPYLLPYFKIKNGETHHKNRYDNPYVLTVHFYGRIGGKEKETAHKLVRANGINMCAQKTEVYIHDDADEIQGVLR